MAGLCIADIDRWSVGEISSVFGICMNVADHCDQTSLILANLDAFKDWTGDAAEAAKDSVHKTRKDLDRNGEVAKKVAEAARKAEQDIIAVRRRLTDLRTEASENGLTIDPHTDTVSAVDPPDMQGWPESDKTSYYREITDLQFRVNTLVVAAVAADMNSPTPYDSQRGRSRTRGHRTPLRSRSAVSQREQPQRRIYFAASGRQRPARIRRHWTRESFRGSKRSASRTG